MLIVSEGFFRNHRWMRIAELKQQLEEMGLDESAMLYEFGLSEAYPAAKEKKKVGPGHIMPKITIPQWPPPPQPAYEEGDLPEPDQSGKRSEDLGVRN